MMKYVLIKVIAVCNHPFYFKADILNSSLSFYNTLYVLTVKAVVSPLLFVHWINDNLEITRFFMH